MENTSNTYVLFMNLLEPQGKHNCCVATDRKRKEIQGFAWEPFVIKKESICVAQEPMENARKTQVLRKNSWKTKENTSVAWEPMKNKKDNTCVAWETIEN